MCRRWPSGGRKRPAHWRTGGRTNFYCVRYSSARCARCTDLTHAAIVFGHLLAHRHLLLVDTRQLFAVLQYNRAARRQIARAAYDLKGEKRVMKDTKAEQMQPTCMFSSRRPFSVNRRSFFSHPASLFWFGTLPSVQSASSTCAHTVSDSASRPRGRGAGQSRKRPRTNATFPALHFALTKAYLRTVVNGGETCSQ
jgi:hypothetical protein